MTNLIDMRDAQRVLLAQAREELRPMVKQFGRMPSSHPQRYLVKAAIERLKEKIRVLSAGEVVARKKLG